MTRIRSALQGAAALLAAAATAIVSSIATATPAHADAAVPPVNSSILVTGRGWGHGIGMSQYGAWGAAEAGLSFEEILDFYYAGTSLGSLTTGNTIRVWISADSDNRLHVVPASGLRITDSAGRVWRMPTGSAYKQWRISRSGDVRVLHYKNADGNWVKKATTLSSSRNWSVSNPDSGYVIVRLPNGTSRDLRQNVSLRFTSSGAKTVNTLTMENYLKSVVPAEMPASWHGEALKAQSVAARSYAARSRTNSSSPIYDVCDTTYCQVYKGLATRSGSTRSVHEQAPTNTAITATANKVVKAGSSVALTMFSSSNGGHAASGGTSYLTAHPDPYDAKMRNPAWSKPISASTIQNAYPSIGTLRSVRVTARDGQGPWGGRATSVTILGSKSSITLNGGQFKSKFGLKERLFLIVGGYKPGTGNYDRWQALGGTPSWVGAPTASEKVVSSGLAATFEDADLFWSSATGSRYLTGPARAAYAALGGPSSALGFPKADTVKDSTGTVTDFQVGRIRCLTGAACVVSYG
ncbi:MAG: SpoIID/LytB domain-containing protein [Micropruina sp.]|nr:SpoIID/LytB domain-containing protein [Micropruina sp.]